MHKTYGCAPVYFAGALVFLAGGGFVMYHGHPVIGTLLVVPGLILVGLTLVAWVMFARLKSAAADEARVPRDHASRQPVLLPQRTRGFSKKRPRRNVRSLGVERAPQASPTGRAYPG